ncbi:4Fe-4S dicluster domain-containing protein [candidate division KSB1 bacterium]|nr:4Fe-4S dicluster domain-containing protein [candidate division KSB1 bacterium]
MLITETDLHAFLQRVVQDNIDGITDVIFPTSDNDGYSFFTTQDSNAEIILDSYRTVDPAKILFYLTRERMTPDEFAPRKRLILGIKACDLKALELMDQALINQEFVDPAYQHWRANSTIVTSDCGTAGATCHCNLLDGHPYAESGFDLNLSRLDDAYLVTVGSDKGKMLLDLMKKEFHLTEAPARAKEQVDENRRAVQKQLEVQNAGFVRSNVFDRWRAVEPHVWADESRQCIGCGACTHICPTCYCLILNDETDAQFVKERSYDSCQLHGYARVAGGGTPRPDMNKRFRNRYLCKFDYMVHNFGKIGCTGCGRCTEACAAEIDFRQVVYNVSHQRTVA